MKNELPAFLGWPFYILERLYAMFNFLGFLFSLLKGIYNECAIHTQVNKQASVARILLAGFFGIFSASINKIFLDAQIKKYNTNTLYPFSPNTPTFNQTLMTNTLIMLMSTYHTQHFHGHHFITSLIHYHYHYVTPHMKTNNAAINSTF